MSTVPDPFFETALSLPSGDRADLAFQLLQSLDLPGTEVSTSEFGRELHSRIDGYRRGEIDSHSLEEVRELMRQRTAPKPGNP